MQTEMRVGQQSRWFAVAAVAVIAATGLAAPVQAVAAERGRPAVGVNPFTHVAYLGSKIPGTVSVVR